MVVMSFNPPDSGARGRRAGEAGPTGTARAPGERDTACPVFDEPALRDLLARVARGDESAFAALYDATVGRCYALALQVTGSESLAELAIERFYAALWHTASRMARVRQGLSLELLRRCRDCAIEAGPAVGNDGPDLVQALAPGHPLRAKLEQLDQNSRTILALALLRKMPLADIAAQLAMDVQVVKAMARAAMMHLRQ